MACCRNALRMSPSPPLLQRTKAALATQQPMAAEPLCQHIDRMGDYLGVQILSGQLYVVSPQGVVAAATVQCPNERFQKLIGADAAKLERIQRQVRGRRFTLGTLSLP